MPDIDNLLLIGSILLFLSVIASKTSGTIGIPSLLLFLLIGMLAGSEGLGGIYFDDPRLAQSLGVFSLTLILFSGGLDTNWQSVRPVVWQGVALSTIGVFLTALSVGVFVHLVADFSLLEGLLLGAIVSSTDAAAVFSILRSKGLGLKGNLRPLLELESGSNDPMAYLLTIGVISLLTQPDFSTASLLLLFAKQMIIGGVMGLAMGKGMVWIINRIRLDYDGLYPVLTLAMVLFIYSFSNFLGGNGFLAVYISGILLGNHNVLHKKSLIRFYDGQAWLVQIIMFVTLGLLVFPSQMLPVVGIGLLVALFLMLVARPLGVFISLAFTKVPIRKKLFISWVGLRGAVPIVFATYPWLENIEKSAIIFHIVFFIVLTSVLLQGTSLGLVAKSLNLYLPEKLKKKHTLDLQLAEGMQNELVELNVEEGSHAAGKAIVQLNLPVSLLIVLIGRENKYLTPKGQTVLMPGDKLWIMADDRETITRSREMFTKSS